MQAKDRVGRATDRSEAPKHGASDAGTGADAHQEVPSKPLLMVDIDGVISLFAAPSDVHSANGTAAASGGSFHSIEGIPHFLSSTAAAHLLELADAFELVWASGWEEKANDHLPHLLGLPSSLPFLRFSRAVGRGNAHWKLDAIAAYGAGRPLAWVDDAFNDSCHAWASERAEPTLLVRTDPNRGLTEREARELSDWARTLAAPAPGEPARASG
jgi:hypothetical protein